MRAVLDRRTLGRQAERVEPMGKKTLKPFIRL